MQGKPVAGIVLLCSPFGVGGKAPLGLGTEELLNSVYVEGVYR